MRQPNIIRGTRSGEPGPTEAVAARWQYDLYLYQKKMIKFWQLILLKFQHWVQVFLRCYIRRKIPASCVEELTALQAHSGGKETNCTNVSERDCMQSRHVCLDWFQFGVSATGIWDERWGFWKGDSSGFKGDPALDSVPNPYVCSCYSWQHIII